MKSEFGHTIKKDKRGNNEYNTRRNSVRTSLGHHNINSSSIDYSHNADCDSSKYSKIVGTKKTREVNFLPEGGLSLDPQFINLAIAFDNIDALSVVTSEKTFYNRTIGSNSINDTSGNIIKLKPSESSAPCYNSIKYKYKSNDDHQLEAIYDKIPESDENDQYSSDHDNVLDVSTSMVIKNLKNEKGLTDNDQGIIDIGSVASPPISPNFGGIKRINRKSSKRIRNISKNRSTSYENVSVSSPDQVFSKVNLEHIKNVSRKDVNKLSKNPFEDNINFKSNAVPDIGTRSDLLLLRTMQERKVINESYSPQDSDQEKRVSSVSSKGSANDGNKGSNELSKESEEVALESNESDKKPHDNYMYHYQLQNYLLMSGLYHYLQKQSSIEKVPTIKKEKNVCKQILGSFAYAAVSTIVYYNVHEKFLHVGGDKLSSISPNMFIGMLVLSLVSEYYTGSKVIEGIDDSKIPFNQKVQKLMSGICMTMCAIASTNYVCTAICSNVVLSNKHLIIASCAIRGIESFVSHKLFKREESERNGRG